MYVSLCAYVKIFFNPTNEMEKEKKKLLQGEGDNTLFYRFDFGRE